MATERGGEKKPTRRTPQQKLLKDREDGFRKSPEGSKGCRAEFLGLRPQARNTRSRRRPGWLLHASKDDISGREASPQLGVHQRQERRIRGLINTFFFPKSRNIS